MVNRGVALTSFSLEPHTWLDATEIPMALGSFWSLSYPAKVNSADVRQTVCKLVHIPVSPTGQQHSSHIGSWLFFSTCLNPKVLYMDIVRPPGRPI